jgi:putative endonuclease
VKWLTYIQNNLLSRIKPTTVHAHWLGRQAEKQAKGFLKNQKSYKILYQNWSAPCGEIDIICKDGNCLVFVEVRARNADALVSGYYSITASKKQKIRKTIQLYLKKLRVQPAGFRFDVVEIRFYPYSDFVINHYTNVSLSTY